MNEFKLSFSGGGFRAAFFSLGAYRRLIELNFHNNVNLISSVSGSSITAGIIMKELAEGNFRDVDDFDRRVTRPMYALGRRNFRRALLQRAVLPRLSNLRPETLLARFSRLFPVLLDKWFFDNQLMTELPTRPEWVCNTTNLNTLGRFRFSRNSMFGDKLGYSFNMNKIKISEAVASSAAFPLLFDPVKLDVRHISFDDPVENYRTLYLTDGAVYDNLGSERLLQGELPYIIMDASAETTPWPGKYRPHFLSKSWRIFTVSIDQVAKLRSRIISRHWNSRGIQLMNSETTAEIIAAQHHYRQSIAEEGTKEMELPQYDTEHEEIEQLLAGLRTDFNSFHDEEMDLLMWAGAVRIDIGVKILFPEALPPHLWEDVPALPEIDLKKAKAILQNGQKRRIVGGFFN
jgi:NTE family protein